MPRDIPVGNGSLLVNFDSLYHLRDLYWPHVGQENHTEGHPSRFGVWVDGAFHWVDADGWERSLRYREDTLVTDVELYHPALELRLHCSDVVDFHENLYLRRIEVADEAGRDREVRLFIAHDLHISGNEVGDTAYYEPERRAVFHYKTNRWFMINGARLTEDGWRLGVDQWAVGVKEAQGREGTWRDAQDGHLSGNDVAQGSVDSTAALHLEVPAGGATVVWYWIAVGDTFEEVTRINRQVRHKGPQTFLDRTDAYWRLWGRTMTENPDGVPEDLVRLRRRSLLILRTQIDNGGAIIAANDFDIAHYGRDTYSYMWPRDGALVAAALVGAGYSEATRRFFDFCHEAITPEGYLLHKYNPDGSLASSWHPWVIDGDKVLPVQEDETALVLWALWEHFEAFQDIEYIKPLFRGLVVRAANWLADYRDEDTGLPLPSWDLWEERRGVHAWTAAATWGGLKAAERFASAFGEDALAERYRDAAAGIKRAVEEHLWQEDLGCFVRMLTREAGGGWSLDRTVDSALVGLWKFGMFEPDHPKIRSTMEVMRDLLWVQTEVGGMARYQDDYYHQVSRDVERIPGNPWFICTLWLAEWLIAVAKSPGEMDEALALIRWAAEHAHPSGVMAEQVHPLTGEPLSVSPLTWSHATYVETVQAYRRALRRIAPEAQPSV